MFVVPDRTADTLIPIILANIRPGTIIISDTYSPYLSLGRDHGLQHMMVNHSLEFVNRLNRFVHTETIEGYWGHVKEWVNSHGGTRTEHLNEKLNEYSWRRSYFKRDGLNVWRILRLIATSGVLGYQSLLAAESGDRFSIIP